MQSRRAAALTAAAALSLSVMAVGATSSVGANAAEQTGGFDRVATYPVFQNLPAGVDPTSETVAEISAASADGKTVIYSDAPGKRIGFVDITDPAAPAGLGTLELATLGHADDQPTSVAVVGDHVLVAIDETGGDFTSPQGTLKVVSLADRSVVRTIDLGGQPDSIAISPDGAYAAIAIENQRDEDAGDGGLPQMPAGSVVLLDLVGADPATWVKRDVALTNNDGTGLQAFVDAGFDTPQDPEPEYVTINDDNKLALTLQENNGIVIIDVPTGQIDSAFSAGTVTVPQVDTTEDGIFNPVDTLTDIVREPDSIGWIDGTHVATANEGDWKGGSRGWTVFDTTTGTVVWDAGNSFEKLATAHGLFNDDRAGNKGAEPEGLTVATIGGKTRAFVGSERSNFVAVYDVSDPAAPVFEQVLPATNGPEGLLAIPERDLLVVSSEVDEADNGVRATVGVYEYGDTRPAFPSIVSAEESSGLPIGWGALGALSAAPGNTGAIWAASDAAYKTGRIYKVDVSAEPALIERVITVRDAAGNTPAIDIEGLHAREDGGFWAALEGTTGAGNKLVRLNGQGRIQSEVTLPADIAAQVRNWGLEGVTAVGTGDSEVLYAVLQRPLFTPGTTTPAEGNVARIGRYDVAAATWSWFTYPMESTTTSGDWIGLSEVTAVDADTLAIIERDKLNGPAAAVKRIYTADLPASGGTADAPVALTKTLALDVLPVLQGLKGWTQEKLEGLTIGADGQVYAVTDNDGLDDATGETQFLRLGAASEVFPTSVTPTPTEEPTNPEPTNPEPTSTPTTPAPTTPAPTTPAPTTPAPTTPAPTTPAPTAEPTPGAKATTKARLKVTRLKGRKVRVVVRLSPKDATGKVVIRDGKRKVKVVKLKNGRARLVVKLSRGKHRLRAIYRGDDEHLRSKSRKVTLRIR